MQSSDLITAASIIAGFGVTVLMFRLQRELHISDENWRENKRTPTWIPPADYLVILAITISLLFGVLPLLMSPENTAASLRLPATAVAATTVLLTGYVPSILAHYHFVYWLNKSRGPFLVCEILLV